MSIDFLTKLYIKIYKSKNIFPFVGESGKKQTLKTINAYMVLYASMGKK
jgi:hypothetical protein